MQSIETADHVYPISLTVARCERIKGLYKVDLMEGEAQSVFADFTNMPRTRLNVLWEMVGDKAECPTAKNPDYDPDVKEGDPGYVPEFFTRKQTFLDTLEGEVLKQADEAFWNELAFFFQSLNPMMEKFITAIRKKNEEASKKIEKAFDKLMESKKVDQITSDEIEKIVNEAEAELEKQLSR